nr:piggyBac transposable element-derived protein 3-like [Penaeus vannamei]
MLNRALTTTNFQAIMEPEPEDIAEYAVDEVDDAYLPQESKEESSSDGDEFPDDTVVLEVNNLTTVSPPHSKPKPKTGRRKFSRLFWEHVHSRDEAPTIPIYDVSDNSENEEGISLPVNLLRRFFSDDLLDMVVQQSNLYSLQRNANKPFDIDRSELEQWLGLCMIMSVSRIPNTRLHWSCFSVGSEKISSSMSRDRWEEIKMNLHLTDNSQIDPNDKLSKIRPLLEHLRSKFKEIPMTEYLCVDEQMVPFKGNSSLKQYIPKKPHKRGSKIFVLADDMGMVYDFMPYVDKIEPVNNPNVPDLKPSANSRIISYKQLQAYGRGSSDEWETVFENGNKITPLKWFDNKAVHLVSTFAT